MTINKGIKKAIDIVFALLFAICSFFTLFHFKKYPLGFEHSIWKTLLFALVAAVLSVLYVRFLNRLAKGRANIVRLFFALFLLAIQVFLFLKVLTPIGWDAFELTNSAECGMYNEVYFIRCPNNLFLQRLLSGWLKLWEGIGFLSALRKMELLNLFFVDCSIGMAFFTAKKLLDVKAADRVFLCSVLLIGFHPTLATIYSDTLAMPFPIGFLFCLVYAGYAKGWKRYALLSLAGVFVTIGFYAKPTVAIIGIAAILILLFGGQIKDFQKQVLAPVLAVILGIGISIIVMGMFLNPVKAKLAEQYPDIKPLGILHYMGIGLSNTSDDASGYGGWNEPEVTWTQQHINNPNYREEALQHIGDRIAEYGPIGYPAHLLNKMIWAGSDGTFFYGMEGGFHVEEQSSQDTLRGKLQNGFYIETEFYQKWYSSWMQGVWLMICILGVVSLFHKSKDYYMGVAKLSILGLFLFLMLFENRSRYLFLYMPVLLIAVGRNCLLTARKVCMVVPASNVMGGIASVVNGYRNSDLEKEFQVTYVESYRNGGKVVKFMKAIKAYFLFLITLVFDRPDLVHIHSSFGPSFYRKMPFIYMSYWFKVPVINHIHGADFDSFYVNANEKKRELVRKVYGKCTKLIALSKEWKSRLSEIVLPDTICVLENYGILRAEREHSFSNRILFMSAIEERKGCFDIPLIFRKVLEQVPDCTLIMAGDGNPDVVKKVKESLKEYVERSVFFPGWVSGEEKERWFQESDLFLLPSYNEGMPMAVLDAMGYGLPVISTNVGGIPQLVFDGKNGFLCEPGDIANFADKIVYYLNNDEARKKAEIAGRQIIKEQYSLELHLNKLAKIYSEVITDAVNV